METAVLGVIYIAIIAALLAGMWKMFEKAGHPGWGALIPIYNTYLLVKTADRPGWWLLLYFIPFVNLIIQLVVYFEIAKEFGQGDGFAIGTAILPVIFLPILGFGDAEYQSETNTDAALT